MRGRIICIQLDRTLEVRNGIRSLLQHRIEEPDPILRLGRHRRGHCGVGQSRQRVIFIAGANLLLGPVRQIGLAISL